MTWKGPDTLRPLLAPIDSLRTHPENPRRGDIDLIAKSLDTYGQLKPVIAKSLDGQDTIYAGNHTWQAAKQLGWTHIAVSRPAYLSDEEADRYLLMDNRASDLAGYDTGELTALLEERADAGTLERTGFDQDDLNELRAEAAALSGATLDEFRQARDEDDAADGPEPDRNPTPPLRQMLLTFRPAETFDGFARKLQTLRKELGTEDVSATIEAVIDRAFQATR